MSAIILWDVHLQRCLVSYLDRRWSLLFQVAIWMIYEHHHLVMSVCRFCRHCDRWVHRRHRHFNFFRRRFDWHNIRTLFVIVATFFIPIHIGEFMVGYWMWLPILRVFDWPLSFDVNFWIDGSGRTCSFRWNWQLHGFKSLNFFNKLGSSPVHPRVM